MNLVVIFQASNISKAFGDCQVLKSVSLVLQEKARVGLVGVNGSGKTTLLKCLSGEIEADTGEIIKSNLISLAYMEQLPQVEEGTTIWEAMMDSFADLLEKRRQLRQLEQEMGQEESRLEKVMDNYARVLEEYERAGGYICEASARRIIIGLGFSEDDFNKPFAKLSGGQKTRLNLGRLLALQADIIMLDEPTNHLDMASMEWLEEWLANYPGTVLLVSHDRMFLDRVVSHIVELRNGKLTSYPGNYTNYLQLKAGNDEAQLHAYEKQQEFIRENEEYIRKYKAGIKARQAKGRQSRLQRLERLEKPGEERDIGSWKLKPDTSSGEDVLLLQGIDKSFGPKTVLKGLDLFLRKGEKVAVIGPNGCGKSTLLKIIAGVIEADRGEMKLGSRVKVAYFSQEFEDLNPDYTILEEIIYNSDLDLNSARSLLGRMLFCGDDVNKLVTTLSGGEKGRLCLLKIILSGANFLLMDEPTNHLDIESRQTVEELLSAYTGTILLVSHDRYFIDQIANRVVAVENKKLKSYPGNYSYYCEKIKEIQASKPALEKTERKEKTPQQQFRNQQKGWQREARRLQNDLQVIEAGINDLEDRKSELENILADPQIYTDETKACQYSNEYQQVQEELSSAYSRWELLVETIEEHNDKAL